MCTVTYLPDEGGYILTHNRDEAPKRSPQHLTLENDMLFPRDTGAGGTWIAVHRQGLTACLLNGAFVKHRHEPPYRRSRGLVLLDFFSSNDPDTFWKNYDFAGIEPFTLLFFAEGVVGEGRWDGVRKYLRYLDPGDSHFWCSATLYPPDMQAKRETVFRNWLENLGHNPSPTDLLRLHHTGSVGDPQNDYVMNRQERVRTVSIAQVVCGRKQRRLRYEALVSGTQERRWFKVKNS